MLPVWRISTNVLLLGHSMSRVRGNASTISDFDQNLWVDVFWAGTYKYKVLYRLVDPSANGTASTFCEFSKTPFLFCEYLGTLKSYRWYWYIILKGFRCKIELRDKFFFCSVANIAFFSIQNLICNFLKIPPSPSILILTTPMCLADDFT